MPGGCTAGSGLPSQGREARAKGGVFLLCALKAERGFASSTRFGSVPQTLWGSQRLPRSLPKALGFRMPWGVIIPVINSGGVTSKPGLRAVLVGLAIRT